MADLQNCYPIAYKYNYTQIYFDKKQNLSRYNDFKKHFCNLCTNNYEVTKKRF